MKVVALLTTICLVVIVIKHIYGVFRERKSLLEGLLSLEAKLSSFIELNPDYLGSTQVNLYLDSQSSRLVEVTYQLGNDTHKLICNCQGNLGNSTSLASLPQSQDFATSLLLSKEIDKKQSRLHQSHSYLINILVHHYCRDNSSEIERDILHYIERDYLFTLLRKSHPDLTIKVVLLPSQETDRSYLESLSIVPHMMSVVKGPSVHFNFRVVLPPVTSASRTIDLIPSSFIPIARSQDDLALFIRSISENVQNSLGGPTLATLLKAAVAKPSLNQSRIEWDLIHNGCGNYFQALQSKLSVLENLMKIKQLSKSLRLILTDVKEVPFFLDLITLIEDALSIKHIDEHLFLLHNIVSNARAETVDELLFVTQRVVQALTKWQSWYVLHLTNITMYQQYLVIYGTFFLPLLVPIYRVVKVLLFN